MWSNYIPFQELRVLQLFGFRDPHVLESAHLFGSPSLETLSLKFSLNRADIDIEDREGTARRMDDAASAFLLGLPPLRSLGLSSTFAERAIESAMSHHGPTLERLNLCPQYSADPWRWIVALSYSMKSAGPSQSTCLPSADPKDTGRHHRDNHLQIPGHTPSSQAFDNRTRLRPPFPREPIRKRKHPRFPNQHRD
jgi:hypothetical protein